MTNDSDVLKTDDKDFVEVDLEGSQSQIDGKSRFKDMKFSSSLTYEVIFLKLTY